MQHVLISTAQIFQTLGMDASRLTKDIPKLVKNYSTRSAAKMTYKDWDDGD